MYYVFKALVTSTSYEVSTFLSLCIMYSRLWSPAAPVMRLPLFSPYVLCIQGAGHQQHQLCGFHFSLPMYYVFKALVTSTSYEVSTFLSLCIMYSRLWSPAPVMRFPLFSPYVLCIQGSGHQHQL